MKKALVWLVAILLIAVVVYAGCLFGNSPKILSIEESKTPPGLDSLAADYLSADYQKLKEVKKIAIVEFTVDYMTRSEEAELKNIYEQNLKFEDSDYAEGTEALYHTFVKKFAAAGYEVISRDKVLNNTNFQKLVGKDTEYFVTYHYQDNKLTTYIMVPAKGFKVTGGGVGPLGSGIVANAMAQAGNALLYPEIAKELGADALLVVHLNVGHDPQGNLLLIKDIEKTGVEFIKLIKPERTNIWSEIKLKENLKLQNLARIGEAGHYSWLESRLVSRVAFREYAARIALLMDTCLDAIFSQIKK